MELCVQKSEQMAQEGFVSVLPMRQQLRELSVHDPLPSTGIERGVSETLTVSLCEAKVSLRGSEGIFIFIYTKMGRVSLAYIYLNILK